MAQARGVQTLQQLVDELERELHLRVRTVTPKGKPDTIVLFARKNGAGKTELCAQHPTGAVQVISTEP